MTTAAYETTQIGNLLDFLTGKPAKEQLQFWEAFRDRHRERIANTEAVLCPELLAAVDVQIARLKPLAATEV